MADDARPEPEPDSHPSRGTRLKRLLLGKPRDLEDAGILHRIALIPILAWVGLGADGLSSSAYGPEEAFKALGEHAYLAVALAAVTAGTVFLISAAYSRIIEEFPHGGGGYLVATRLLGPAAGVVSGGALLVDYMLTITISLAAAGDAIFSFLPIAWSAAKLGVEAALIVGLTALNIRGVKESVLVLAPVFFAFLATHAVAIVGGILAHAGAIPETAREVSAGFQGGLSTLGVGGMALLFAHAYSLGGGTYTGIEAVSNGLPIMREPRVRTGKRTMLYMSVSLAFTAGGLILCYLLWEVAPVEGKTMNAALLERMTAGLPFGRAFVIVSLLSAAALLVVAAQAGFLDGPRVLASMAVDSWAPHRFAALSERLTTMNGIALMGAAAFAALLYTEGDVDRLVVMYSINVFLTFSLSTFGMLRLWAGRRRSGRPWVGTTALFAVAFVVCATILVITVIEKFGHGGWVTLLVTGAVVGQSVLVRRHYRGVYARLALLDRTLKDLPLGEPKETPPLDPKKPTAAILVGGYSGLGIHTVLDAIRGFPGHFHNLLFLSVGVLDSGDLKGEDAVGEVREQTERALERYIEVAARLGMPAACRMAVGTEVVGEAEALCLAAAKEFPRITFFAGQLIFREEAWYHAALHNQTAFAVQKRLQFAGQRMVILPVRMR